MVVTQIYDFAKWLPGAIAYFFELGGALALAGIVISFLIAAFRYGPLEGGDLVFRVVTTAVADLLRTSPRRVWAIARLAIQESLRRNVLVALGVFIVVLLFAGWFLDTSSHEPSTLYLSFVLSATTYLAWTLAVFISAFSLPADFKNRTIFTVVTKPVRPGEIVLGRILGFSIIGTVLLALMGGISYVFAYRLLDHTHEVDVASLRHGRRFSRRGVGRSNFARPRASPRGAVGSRRQRHDRRQERPLAQRDGRARRRQNPLRTLGAAGDVRGPGADLRRIAVQRPGRAGRRAGDQRRQGVEVPQLRRGSVAGGGHLDLSRRHARAVSRRAADRDDDPRVSQPQGQHQQGDHRQPGGAKSRKPAAAAWPPTSRPRTTSSTPE